MVIKLKRRCSILFHLLVPGGKWQMSHMISQFLERCLPQPTATAIASASISGNHQFCSPLKALRSHLLPPSPHGGRGELCCMVINSHTDPPLVTGQIVNTIRNCFAQFLVWKVMNADFHWLALRFPLLTRILEFSHQFLLFCVYRDHRLSALLKTNHPSVDVLKLSVSILMPRAFAHFAVGLQTVADCL
jgi:hypothetical protein